MEKRKLQGSAVLAVFWILLLAVTLITATYAWFTISAVTNVEPMDSAVSRGDVYLLISASREGPFERECRLVSEGNFQDMYPVSTADLEHFYEAAAQNSRGIVSLYRDASDRLNTAVLHGVLYLRSEYRACQVYLRRSGLDFGLDGQMLAAMRLGMKITTEEGTETRIFRLDDLGNTGGAAATVTVTENGSVVSSVNGAGKASFVRDPSVDISDYMAVENGGEDESPEPGNQALCSLQEGEVASVEFWLYLEGCDENCINQVQQRESGLQFAFAGVPVEEGEES